MSKEPKDLGERLYPEARSAELAMDMPQVHRDLEDVRDRQQLNEAQTEQMRKTHCSLLTGIVNPSDMQSVHGSICNGLVHRPVTEEQRDTEAKRYDSQLQETMTKGRQEHTWAWDTVWKRAKEMVAERPALVKLLKDSSQENSPRFWLAVARQARAQLKKEGKLR